MNRRALPALLAIFAPLVLTACLETAVSADEKMARACGKYVDATTEESTGRILLQLRESRHWAELARNQDRARWQPSFEALSRLVRDADDPNRTNRDPGAGEAASRLIVRNCLEIVEDPEDQAVLENEPLIVIRPDQD
jgi:hypothetical protein